MLVGRRDQPDQEAPDQGDQLGWIEDLREQVEYLRDHLRREQEASVASQQTPTERPWWRRLFKGG